jgi:hypothetical protein
MEHADPVGAADPVEVTASFTAARELLLGAEVEAARIRTDADRYARQRAQEAELLVAKARRLLGAAEEKAALILATARAGSPAAPPAEPVAVIDLTGTDPVVTVASDADSSRAGRGAPGGPAPTELDRMLASAIAHAVEASLPADPRP